MEHGSPCTLNTITEFQMHESMMICCKGADHLWLHLAHVPQLAWIIQLGWSSPKRESEGEGSYKVRAFVNLVELRKVYPGSTACYRCCLLLMSM